MNDPIVIAHEDVPKMPEGLSPQNQRRWLEATEALERANRSRENFHERDNQGRLTREAMARIVSSGLSVVDSRVTGYDNDNNPIRQGVSLTKLEHLPSEIELAGDDEEAQNRLIDSYNKKKAEIDANLARLNNKKSSATARKQEDNKRAAGQGVASDQRNQTGEASLPSPLAGASSPPAIQTVYTPPPDAMAGIRIGDTGNGSVGIVPNKEGQNPTQPSNAPQAQTSGQQSASVAGAEVDELDEQMVEGHPLKFWDGKDDEAILKMQGMSKKKLKTVRDAQAERDAIRESERK